MLAARNGHAETFQILARQKSVDFTVTNRAGQNIVDIIKASNDNRLKKLLEENEEIKRQTTEKNKPPSSKSNSTYAKSAKIWESKKSTGLPCRGKPAANGRQPFELPDKRRRIRRQTNNPLKTYRAFGRTFFRQGKKLRTRVLLLYKKRFMTY